MDLGNFSVSLAVKDLKVSRAFYEKLGFSMIESDETQNSLHSIRIDRQWRICFVWRDGDAHEVEIVDYH